MNSYSKKLIEKTKVFLAGGINDASVMYALVQLNKASQDCGHGPEFMTINFYRDWLVHTDLDRNKSLLEFFEQWDEIINGIKRGVGIDIATEKSSEPLKFEHLFTELTSLGIKLETRERNLFIKVLVESLLDAPIRRQSKHVKEFRFTFDSKRKQTHSTYVCHMQIQLTNDKWFDGPEFHSYLG